MTPTLVFSAVCLIQLGYWAFLHLGFRRAYRTTSADTAAPLPALSIIVAARDEEAVLPDLLQALTRQSHPDCEIIIVDDDSTDGTAAVVRAWAERHDHIRLVRMSAPRPPRKKHALTQGIKAASHDLLAFTDADCRPPAGWAESLARHHAARDENMLLVGYSPYRPRPGLLNRLARYETFVTGFLTAAAVGLGRPYMAVGRNMSYPRSLFRRIGGFEHSLQSLSGDDDLLVQEVKRRDAASVHHVFDASTFVETDAPDTWRGWLHQKRRHTSAGRFYQRSVQLHLALFQGTNIVLWFAPLIAGWTGFALLGLKLTLQTLILSRAARILREPTSAPALPFLDLMYAGYNLIVAPLGLARIPNRW